MEDEIRNQEIEQETKNIEKPKLNPFATGLIVGVLIGVAVTVAFIAAAVFFGA